METIRVWDWMETTRVWDGIKTRHPLLGNVSSVKAGLHVYVEINESTPPPPPKGEDPYVQYRQITISGRAMRL